ncbi:cupin domain-containing protein [Roseospira visakhapatnamensis]|uniref:Quercetin dioxygenase-like cupin family protein n=1 Tax=Roseospira visakhapatnamensis TaxID=390880 RepID=A0A7W6RGL4_9PROT|nr:cupin domain-containing protein [Roseospira visakhapatnamensis]MBB4267463.1 quercetin dioxygenase-like cupin family protein [Roseospira visakhapatnamensis]
MTDTPTPGLRRPSAPFRWEGVDVLAYKEEGGAPFKAVSRQVLFAEPVLSCELRYFECDPGGHTTLERHEHAHAVMLFRGGGLCLLGDRVRRVAVPDLVLIPPMTWHQFRAGADDPLGFLCMVNADRDRPRLPTEADLAALRALGPRVAAFLDGDLAGADGRDDALAEDRG